MNIILNVNFSGSGGGRQKYSQKRIIIGKGPAANLKIEDKSISDLHAILKASEEDDSFYASDLGSDTGTKVNGKTISREVKVSRGDYIQVGNIEISIVGVGADAEDTVVGKPPVSPRKDKPRPPAPSPSRRSLSRRAPRKAWRTSGENFFVRELHPQERPEAYKKRLEVKVMWGPVAVDVAEFKSGQEVTIGRSPNAGFNLYDDRFAESDYTLLSPAGPDGYIVNIASGMNLEVRREGQKVDIDLPDQGANRTYNMAFGDKCRIMMGQLAFVVQFVTTTQGVFSGSYEAKDHQLGKWVSIFLVLAVGMWLVFNITPKKKLEMYDYLKNPARFAKLILPDQKADKKKTFEELKKKKIEKTKVEDDAKWKKVTVKSKSKATAEVPREVKEKMDRKIATSAGILGLLKGKGGGTGDNASSIFGGSAMASLDENLAGLRSSGMDSGGFGGLGTRGGTPGGGGGGLGLGGLGTSGYGRGSGAGYGSVKIVTRGRHNVKVVKGRTKVMGSLSQEIVGRYLKRYWAQFKFCYEKELTKEPNLYGKITVSFTIGGNGRITEAAVMQSSMNNSNVEQCILRVIRRIRFPKPKGGGEVIVTYPFMFTTAG
jgi:TonB family protein